MKSTELMAQKLAAHPELRQALDRFADEKGRSWKRELEFEWERGCSRIRDLNQVAHLQTLRNASWFKLAAYRTARHESRRLAEVVTHAPAYGRTPASYKTPDGSYHLSCEVSSSNKDGRTYRWTVRDYTRRDAYGYAVEIAHTGSLVRARIALQRHLDEIAAVAALSAGLEQHARNAGLVHEYRVTRPDLYAPGTVGHTDPSARLGYYVWARDEVQARVITRQNYVNEMGPCERLDVQLWQTAVGR